MTNQLPLSAKGMNKETAHDYTCDYPGCTNRATSYLFMRQQFCDEHRIFYVPLDDHYVPWEDE